MERQSRGPLFTGFAVPIVGLIVKIHHITDKIKKKYDKTVTRYESHNYQILIKIKELAPSSLAKVGLSLNP